MDCTFNEGGTNNEDSYGDFKERFKQRHGRYPSGEEIFANFL